MNKSKRGIMRTYDAIARDFDATRYKPWPNTVEFVREFKKGDLVLDLGCGNGRNLRYFESKGISIIGLDIAAQQLKVVRDKEGVMPVLVQGDVCHLPFRDERVEGVVFVATLHHLGDEGERKAALHEIYRCLKYGGVCLTEVWAREQEKFEPNIERARVELGESWAPGDMLLDWKLPSGETHARYYHLFTKIEFEELLVGTEFEIVRTAFEVDNHYAILKK